MICGRPLFNRTFIPDSKIHQGVLFGHTDAVWDLCVHPVTGYLLSSAADGSCRLWNHHQTSAQIREFRTEPSEFRSFFLLYSMMVF